MHTRTWLRRLSAQCPGWYFWYSEQFSPRVAWHAVPAPRDGEVQLAAPRGEVDASSPQLLRRFCSERYGWYDSCDECGAPARECRHSELKKRAGARA